MSVSRNTPKNGSRGYILLQRKLFSHAFWEESRTYSRAEAFLDLLQLAAFEPTKRFSNGKLMHLQLGELVASERYLVGRWNWSRTKVRSFIGILKEDKELDQRKDQGETVLILVNYRDYTDSETKKKPQTRPDEYQRSTNEEPGKNQQIPQVSDNQGQERGEISKVSKTTKITPNNTDCGEAGRPESQKAQGELFNGSDPKPEKPKPKKNTPPPTLDEWLAYAGELSPNWLKHRDNCENAFDHYEANGWKQNGGKPIKDWKAACRTCHRNWKERYPDRESKSASPSRRTADDAGAKAIWNRTYTACTSAGYSEESARRDADEQVEKYVSGQINPPAARVK